MNRESPEAATAIYEAAKSEFGAENVRYADSRKEAGTADFPVRDRDGKSVSSLALSQALQQLPEPRNEYVYVVRDRREDARAEQKKAPASDRRHDILNRQTCAGSLPGPGAVRPASQ